MLAYFPVPYQDELLYSVIARYAVHTGQTDNQKGVLRDVFGLASAVAIPDLPSHLTSLTIQLRHVWSATPQELIQSHTLAPFYLPFLRPEQARQIIKSMLSNQGGTIHTRSGISASSVSRPLFFRYCPICVIEQLDVLGEPYWNRINQLTGVNNCIKHRCRLGVSKLQFPPKQKHLYQAAAKSHLEELAISAELSSIESLLIHRFRELLAIQSIKGHSSYQWTMFYQKLARRLGFMEGSRVEHAGVREKLLWDWKNTDFESHIVSNSENDWLINIFRKHRKAFHPLRHILVWCSLLPEKSVEEIIGDVGRQPKKETKVTEVFPVSDDQSALTKSKRNLWLRLLKKFRGSGVKTIRSSSPGGAVYAWLYRHDRAWLMANRPSQARRKNVGRKADYLSWDQQNLDILQFFKASVQEDDTRQRLSQTFYIKQLPRASSVEKHLADLPKTKKWLEKNAESVEDYQSFRINRAARVLFEEFKPIKKWRLLRLAGVRAEKVTPIVERLIQKLESEGVLIDGNKPEKFA